MLWIFQKPRLLLPGVLALLGVDSTMSEPLLEFEDLRISFRLRERVVEAVRGLTMSVNAGEVVALVGESGSGKSVSALAAMRLLQAPPAFFPGGAVRWRG